MKTYTGSRTIDGIRVRVDDDLLPERYDIQTFSKGGFEWTYVGAGPKQLALALLADHLGDDRKALELCDDFMRAVVSDLDNDWEITSADIDEALSKIGQGDRT
jgi:hypothetical protein